MLSTSSSLKYELIDSLMESVRKRLPAKKADDAALFLSKFFAHVPPDDMLASDPEDLVGSALSMWAFGGNRAPGTTKIRIYNPRFDSDGWQSGHTVIEIINDDMPFLVDSVTSALTGMDLTVHLVIHPIIRVTRNAKSVMTHILDGDADDADAIVESVMHLQISEQSSVEMFNAVERNLRAVIDDVRAAVEDWRAMRAKMLEVIDGVTSSERPGAEEELDEVCDFLRWLEDNHFTFLGYRNYDYLGGTGRNARMEIAQGSGLGILRDPDVRVFENMRALGDLPADVREFMLRPRRLLIMKANRKSTVHRPVHLDSVSVKKIDAKGKVTGEHRFIGLLTSVAYNESPRKIPLLRRKVANVVERAGFRASSHNGKVLVNILETYPRDELFQATEAELLDTAVGILHMQERRRSVVFVRLDAFERFASCIVFLPRETYNAQLRERVMDLLAKTFNGTLAAFYPMLSDAPLVRLHVIIKTTRGEIPKVDGNELQRRLTEVSRGWDDKLHQAAIEAKGEESGNHLFRRYGKGFPSSYRETNSHQAAIHDMVLMEDVLCDGTLGMNLFRPIGADDTTLHLKFFNKGAPLPLSDIMPTIENMGARVISESPHEVTPRDNGEVVWIHDFKMTLTDGDVSDLGRIKQPCQDALAAVWDGRMENDGFNVLVLKAGLSWREVSVLRAYAKYLRQTTFTFSQPYIQETLSDFAAIARLLIDLFLRRFDPRGEESRGEDCAAIVKRIEDALDDVDNLDQDRILRRFLNLLQSTLRTNYFQKAENAESKSYVSFKLDSRAIDDLPLPRPMVEVWVYSPRVEAVHLRGGAVARGGIRWSDRREDFRTEILGLMKAQMTKNAVIVPVGSKGGFVVKNPPVAGSREEIQAEGIECYKTLMRGLLDITDNMRGGAVFPPGDVVRHDGDDPYLVVAADKGTATFSDIANGVSLDYGFWLGDAFASGGSAGYDHKKMAITAKGAWESVKRHFREIGTDIQSTDFTVVGCGDMSGDVFGNGMLLSRHIRLMAAFNHLHIFVDPDPDAANGWQERKRLFDLPRSSWSDYDAALISEGGGVFARSAKSISLSSQIKAAFNIEADTVTPSELIRAILTAEIALLWFGGIGTYVKSAEETNADVGDRVNDAHRIDGAAVRAKVIGEGANLGVTQRGRMEYALRGGRINTDAIDNSAGVDCSDHEVNIKILLGDLVGNGDMTTKQRDALLVEMTDNVSELVLKDNYDQSQAITMARAIGVESLDSQTRLIRQLERGPLKLDRSIEFLPDDEGLAERAAAGSSLSRPEIAILLAYAKMALYDELLPSSLPDDPLLLDDLKHYFPDVLSKSYPEAVARHRLRREIVATYVTNSMVNRVGATFVNAVREQTGDSAPDIARAYIAARDIFRIRSIWGRVEDLDNKVPADIQARILHQIRVLVERGAIWLLRNETHPLDLQAVSAVYIDRIDTLRGCLSRVMSEFDRGRIEHGVECHIAEGVPEELARDVASAELLVSGFDLARLSATLDAPIAQAAEVYFYIGNHFALDWLRERASKLEADSHWQKLAVSAVVDDLYNHQITLARDVLITNKAKNEDQPTAAKSVKVWLDGRGDAAERVTRLLSDLRAGEDVDLAMLAVANGQFRTLLSH